MQLLAIFTTLSLQSFLSLFLAYPYFKFGKHLKLNNLVAFAIGALLGDAFFHIIPEALVSDITLNPSMLIAIGLLLFFVLEKILRWRHCHEPTAHHHLASISITGDMFHNFIDGALIAASYLIDIKLGLATTMAVILHEIPQEVGDIAIMIHSGYSIPKAIKFNFLSSLSAFVGAILVLVFGNLVSNIPLYLLPITAGGFIYLAASDLIPELHRHDQSLTSTLSELLFICLGLSLMYLLLFIGE